MLWVYFVKASPDMMKGRVTVWEEEVEEEEAVNS